MSGLPDDLRSLAATFNIASEMNRTLNRAADELDARAARILRLEMVIKRAMTVVSAADAPDDEWVQDLEMKIRPGVTPTEDPTCMPMLVSDLVPKGVVEVRVGEKVVCKIIGIGP